MLPAIANQAQSAATGFTTASDGVTKYVTGYAIDTSGGVHAVIWTVGSSSTTVTDLGNISGGATEGVTGRSAMGVNSSNTVVGEDVVNGNPLAFIWTSSGGMVKLNSLLQSAPGVNLTEATGINDSGEIIADGTVNSLWF